MADDGQWKVPGRFSKDSYHLYRYFLLQLLLFAALDVGLFFRPLPWPALHPSILQTAGLMFVSLYVGLLSSVFIHNAAHDNFKPRWLNFPVGELMGLIHLYGFWGLKEGHMIHHRYPDHPVLDPHRPSEKSLIRFVFTMNRGVYFRVMYFYFRNADLDRVAGRRVWAWTTAFWLSSVLAKLGFWYLLLGPQAFALYYLPAAIAAWVSLAHGNFVTHRPRANSEEFDIINLDHSVGYKVLNSMLFGIYMHKNHHLNVKLFNPAKLKESKSPPSK